MSGRRRALLAGMPLTPKPAMKNINWQIVIRKTNLILAIAWAFMIPVTLYTGWIYSIAFISAASIYANFISHIAAWRADVPNNDF